MTPKHYGLVFAAAVLLASCGADDLHDIKAFVAESNDLPKGRVPPLPVLMALDTVKFDAFDLPDPFWPGVRSTKVAPVRVP